MDRNKYIAAFVGLVVVILFFVVLGSRMPFGDGSQGAGGEDILSDLSLLDGEGELVTQDILEGTGAEATEGNVLTVHYTGTLEDGTVFDGSVERGEPFSFTLGAGEVIEGWDEGLVGMRVGGKRVLVIPPDLAYGARQVGPIPANSTLTFEVELIEVSD